MIRNLSRIVLLLLCFSCRSLSKKVDQEPSSILGSPHGSATISCNHSDSLLKVILWYQQPVGSSGLELIGYIQFTNDFLEDKFKEHFKVTGDGSKKSELHVLKLRQAEDSGMYFCAATLSKFTVTGGYEAHFGGGTRLTVLEKDRDPVIPTVRVLPPSPKECGQEAEQNKKKKTIVCVASGFYPDHVSVFWSINGENKTSGVATDSAAVPEGKSYSISSRLRVSAKDWNEPENKFTCTVNFYNGTNYLPVSESIRGVEGGEGKVVSRETFLRVTVSAKLSYTVFIVKSCFYGAFVTLLVWKLQASAGKQTN
uniref:M1-specific T cell receptor beta chain-like n=1 Tax=Semicossyphus pulcher TaxID=241346 RepID=UPI0037E8A117